MTRDLLAKIKETENEFDQNFKLSNQTMDNFVQKLVEELEAEHDKHE